MTKDREARRRERKNKNEDFSQKKKNQNQTVRSKLAAKFHLNVLRREKCSHIDALFCIFIFYNVFARSPCKKIFFFVRKQNKEKRIIIIAVQT